MLYNNTNELTNEMLQDILLFFVTVAQKKILTRADGGKPEITNFYNHNRYNTEYNYLSFAHKNNIKEYAADGAKLEWFNCGLECIHFYNGNPQNRNYAYGSASIHFSYDKKYALELMLKWNSGSNNLITALSARYFKLFDDTGKHCNKATGYPFGNDVLFEIPVSISQKQSGEIDGADIQMDSRTFHKFYEALNNMSSYFTKKEVDEKQNINDFEIIGDEDWLFGGNIDIKKDNSYGRKVDYIKKKYQ